MKLYAIHVLYREVSGSVRKLTGVNDLSSFGYFQRSSVDDFMNFTSKILVERTSFAERSTVKEQEYVCHVYVRHDGLSGVVICDNEYPPRVAFTFLTRLLDEYSAQHNSSSWTGCKENTLHFSKLNEYLQKYQNPKEADSMMRIQADLDDTKVILHNTIDSVLERGEKLDDLVAKSEGLSSQSKAFYKTARKTNSCCILL